MPNAYPATPLPVTSASTSKPSDRALSAPCFFLIKRVINGIRNSAGAEHGRLPIHHSF